MEIMQLNPQADIKRMLTELEKVRVMVCFENLEIIGQTYYPPEQRFLDMLNNDIVLGKQRIRDFIIVTDALLVNPDGEKEQIPNPCYISKNSIILIGTFDETRSTTSESINSVRAYPWRKKTILPARMMFAGKYRLVGHMHSDPGALPTSTIESRNRFLPMTNVEVTSPLEQREIFFDFLAVNNKHVSLFQSP